MHRFSKRSSDTIQNLLPLTETEQRRVRKAQRGPWSWLVLFALLVPVFGYLFILTITDRGFRASDGYVVAGFTGFITLLGAGATWGTWQSKGEMALILAHNQKQVLAGQVTRVLNHGTLRFPKIYWEIKGVAQPTVIRPVNVSALVGLKSLYEVEVGDWVEVHQAAAVPLAVEIIKLKAPVGIK